MDRPGKSIKDSRSFRVRDTGVLPLLVARGPWPVARGPWPVRSITRSVESSAVLTDQQRLQTQATVGNRS